MLPDTPVFGPRMRYVGMSGADVLASLSALSRCSDELSRMARLLEQADLSDVVQGTLRTAIQLAFIEVQRELRALSCEVFVRTDQLNRAIGR